MYQAEVFTAIDGTNRGDPICCADDLVPGDTYQLCPRAAQKALSVVPQVVGAPLRIASGTECGRVGASVHLDCSVMLMASDGTVIDALLLAELDREGRTLADLYILPLAEIAPRTGYTLVEVDRDTARLLFADAACISFTAGTRITMADGSSRAVETLCVGDEVRTRDNGNQAIRWVGHRTMRAVGVFAPIRIGSGAIGNEADLLVSPNHRLFVQDRSDLSRASDADRAVKARTLVNGHSVVQTSGGFVDYYTMLFDRHEVVFAEGIAAETLLLDQITMPAVPSHIVGRLASGLSFVAVTAEHDMETPEPALASRTGV